MSLIVLHLDSLSISKILRKRPHGNAWALWKTVKRTEVVVWACWPGCMISGFTFISSPVLIYVCPHIFTPPPLNMQRGHASHLIYKRSWQEGSYAVAWLHEAEGFAASFYRNMATVLLQAKHCRLQHCDKRRLKALCWVCLFRSIKDLCVTCFLLCCIVLHCVHCTVCVAWWHSCTSKQNIVCKCQHCQHLAFYEIIRCSWNFVYRTFANVMVITTFEIRKHSESLGIFLIHRVSSNRENWKNLPQITENDTKSAWISFIS